MPATPNKADKRKMIMRIIVCILVLFLLASVALPLIIYGAYTQNDVDELEDKLGQLDGKKDEIEGDLATIDGKKQTQMEQKIQLENEIDTLRIEISDVNTQIENLLIQIAEKEEESVALQQDYEAQYALYRKRVKATYEEGNVSYLNVLLAADSFSDMLTRLDFVGMMIEKDNKTMDTLTAQKQAVEDKKLQIEQNKQEQEQLKASLQEKKSSLDGKAAQCDEILAQINADEDSLKAAYEEAEQYEKEVEAEIKRVLKEIAKQNTVYVGGDYIWPLPSSYTRISSHFGYRYHPILHYYKLHTGTDFGAPTGVSIYAANSGTVITSKKSTAYGNYVMINHGGGHVTLYAHMSKRLVSEGDVVSQGDTIGLVGSTGYSTNPHLHFEIRVNGDYKDPMTYYTKQ